MSRQTIIGFDGIDGSGKTSLIERLMQDNTLKGKCVFSGGGNPPSPYDQQMYSMMPRYRDSFDALKLFVRAMLFRYSKMPSNKIILSDRTLISALLFYKSISELANIHDQEFCEEIERRLQEYKPNLSVIILLNVFEARKRIIRRREPIRPVEEMVFQELYAEHLAKIQPSSNTLIIDTGNLDADEVHDLVKQRITSTFSDLLQ